MRRDLTFALRMLTRERLLSAAVVVTAALGIGGATAVFSVVNAVLLRDLPYANAEQLYVMRALAPDGLPGNVTRRAFAPIYISSEQFIFRRRAVVVRTSLDAPETLVPAIRRELDSLDPQLGAQFGVYDTLIRTSIARERLGMTLLVVFGLAAMLLAAVGVYGLMSYSVAQRTGEIAVRSAMGASAKQVLALVMGRGMRLAGMGIVLGAVGAVALRQVVASELYGVSPLDLTVFLLVTATLFAVATLACFVPARRAMKIDPVNLLRNE